MRRLRRDVICLNDALSLPPVASGRLKALVRLPKSSCEATAINADRANARCRNYLPTEFQSVLGSRDLRIQEHNRWPNVEGRVSMGLGPKETLVGNRKARPFELGSSAFVGQIH